MHNIKHLQWKLCWRQAYQATCSYLIWLIMFCLNALSVLLWLFMHTCNMCKIYIIPQTLQVKQELITSEDIEDVRRQTYQTNFKSRHLACGTWLYWVLCIPLGHATVLWICVKMFLLSLKIKQGPCNLKRDWHAFSCTLAYRVDTWLYGHICRHMYRHLNCSLLQCAQIDQCAKMVHVCKELPYTWLIALCRCLRVLGTGLLWYSMNASP